MYEKNKKNKLYKQNKIDETESSTYRNQERYREGEYEEKKVTNWKWRRVRVKRVGTYKEKHLREITRNVHSIRDRNNYLKQVSPTKKNMLSQPPNLIYFDTYTKKTKIL